MQMTHFSFYDHDATQSESAIRPRRQEVQKKCQFLKARSDYDTFPTRL